VQRRSRVNKRKKGGVEEKKNSSQGSLEDTARITLASGKRKGGTGETCGTSGLGNGLGETGGGGNIKPAIQCRGKREKALWEGDEGETGADIKNVGIDTWIRGRAKNAWGKHRFRELRGVMSKRGQGGEQTSRPREQKKSGQTIEKKEGRKSGSKSTGNGGEI